MDDPPCAPGSRASRARYLAQLGRRVTLRTAPALALLVAACTTAAPPPRTAAPPPLPPSPVVPSVTGKTPAAAIALLGRPAMDRSEGRTRQLQYRSPTCVVDLFAVAAIPGGAATIGHIEARTPRGDRADAAACLGGLLPR